MTSTTAPRAAPGQPFGTGSVSLGLYLEDLEPPVALAELARQAELAIECGFDGVNLSEHHAGFDGYLPSPLLGISWLLDRMDVGWAAACPILLPLRPVNLVVEDIAWLTSRHPGRVGVGFAPGFAEADFEIAGASHADRRATYYRNLPIAVRALRGEAPGLLADDPAVRWCAAHPVPVLAAVAGPIGAREAARAGAGMLVATFKDAAESGDLTATYRDYGGTGARVLVRRCWLGPKPPKPERRPESGIRRSTPRAWATGERTDMVTAMTAEEMVDQLADRLVAAKATSHSIRLQLPGSSPETTREQIRRFGTEVLPGLRERIATAAGQGVRP
jgi:alkanesulfonate monooxygenase SsuD/methylene tetrahydromethanopterin reductase-like flavin-dependent oxidoreductase (luciferase family)